MLDFSMPILPQRRSIGQYQQLLEQFAVVSVVSFDLEQEYNSNPQGTIKMRLRRKFVYLNFQSIFIQLR